MCPVPHYEIPGIIMSWLFYFYLYNLTCQLTEQNAGLAIGPSIGLQCGTRLLYYIYHTISDRIMPILLYQIKISIKPAFTPVLLIL
jgi:hypothetical protein